MIYYRGEISPQQPMVPPHGMFNPMPGLTYHTPEWLWPVEAPPRHEIVWSSAETNKPPVPKPSRLRLWWDARDKSEIIVCCIGVLMWLVK